MKSVIAFMIVVSSQGILAQPACLQAYPSAYEVMTLPTALPPISSGMSFDERIAHIALDSICRTLESTQIDSLLRARTGLDDTLKAMMKYITVLVDEDPLAVFGITNTSAEWRLSSPTDIRNALAESVRTYSPSPGIDESISTSDYIMVVTVQDTTNLVDTSAQIAKTAIVSTATISQVLLGHVFPPCTIQALTVASPNPIACIWFDTRKENFSHERREIGLPHDISTVTAMMPTPSRQYLVFLRLTLLCRDMNNAYYTLYPAYWVGSQCGLFEVTSSKIIDSQNYFGLGINPLLQDVVSAITNRVQTIKAWTP